MPANITIDEGIKDDILIFSYELVFLHDIPLRFLLHIYIYIHYIYIYMYIYIYIYMCV